ncbi:hypothetical protein BBBOND_0309190 [Babesia bigemina]|uniref:Uncharacterized protein n=1 Tax=Babesia bigemina TaxID=5866 RepID=A0A061D8H9_BABBI|nr:hypothetical protein BBBOND_0309190 [Babesia bigemina]CDR97016.1 hypothetical protein BBBOND_0309190 [Babesia bigemina]|eukprot:XP_012769202.1 hypothetical protein BBBOND_0309190 [Babesia bigemina]
MDFASASGVVFAVLAFILFTSLIGYAIYLYKTKSTAYLIPKEVYEWTGYTSACTGPGSKHLS